MPDKERKEEILSRLKNIRGHIDGIIKMVEEEKECEEIMLQIAAVKKAIEKVGYFIIESHAVECLSSVGNKDDIQRILSIMMKFLG